jgi:hypothetical protein
MTKEENTTEPNELPIITMSGCNYIQLVQNLIVSIEETNNNNTLAHPIEKLTQTIKLLKVVEYLLKDF